MAKYTLLELVQNVLSSMDSDEVASINDTVESQQVVKIIKSKYFELFNRGDMPENFSLVNINGTNSSTPVLMTIPSNVSQLKWLKYDNATTSDTDVQMVEVTYLPLSDFLDMIDTMDQDGTNVGNFDMTLDSYTYKFMYWTDRAPRYYASIDDYNLIFDAYDSSVETHLSTSRTRAYAKLTPNWSETDGATVTLNDAQFDLLLNECKALAWMELKQTPHPKAEQSIKRGWTYLNKTKHDSDVTSDFDQLPDFGRVIGRIPIVRLH